MRWRSAANAGVGRAAALLLLLLALSTDPSSAQAGEDVVGATPPPPAPLPAAPPSPAQPPPSPWPPGTQQASLHGRLEYVTSSNEGPYYLLYDLNDAGTSTSAVFFVGMDTPALRLLLRQAPDATAGSVVDVTCQLDGAAGRCLEVLQVTLDQATSGGTNHLGPPHPAPGYPPLYPPPSHAVTYAPWAPPSYYPPSYVSPNYFNPPSYAPPYYASPAYPSPSPPYPPPSPLYPPPPLRPLNPPAGMTPDLLSSPPSPPSSPSPLRPPSPLPPPPPPPPPLDNLALGALVYLSSALKGYCTPAECGSRWAVDGDTLGIPYQRPVPTPDGDNNPWMSIDLGNVGRILEVAIWLRQDECCRDSAQDAEVRVGLVRIASPADEPSIRSNALVWKQQTAASFGSVRIPLPGAGMDARWVTLQNFNGAKQLQVLEVEVYGIPGATVPGYYTFHNTDYPCNDLVGGAVNVCDTADCCKAQCDMEPRCALFMFGSYGWCPNCCWTKTAPSCQGFSSIGMNVYVKQPREPVYTHLGCYADNSNSFRQVPIWLARAADMTIEMCGRLAARAGYSLFRLQYSTECKVGNDKARATALGTRTTCTMRCGGNSSQICGGYFANSVYRVGDSSRN